MRFDPTRKDLFRSYPVLKIRSSVFGDMDGLKFLLWFCAPDSPLAAERDYQTRVDESRKRVGMDEDHVWFKKFEEGHITIHEQVYELFRLWGDPRFELWITLRFSYHILSSQMRDPYGMKTSDRGRAGIQLKSLLDQIISIEEILFPDEVTKMMIQERVSAKSLQGFAEQFSQEVEIY